MINNFEQGHQIKATTGHHLLCTLVHTGLDDAGRSHSMYFATTEKGHEVKLRFETQLSGQLQDVNACFTVVEMESRGVERAIGELVRQFPRGAREQRKDRDRRVLKHIWYHVLGE